MKKRLLFYLILFVFVSKSIVAETTATIPTGWVDGSGGNITSLSELRWLSETPLAWNETWTLTNNIDASETIDWNNGAGFSPIGKSSAPFTGKFYGNNYEINSVYINRPTSDSVGFFGYVYSSSANIEKLHLVNCDITGKARTGGLIGYLYNARVSYCSVAGEVYGNGIAVGLVVGYSHFQSFITNCYAKGTAQGTSFVGGFVGYVDNQSRISNCTSNVAVIGTLSSIGGFAGFNYNNSKISNCLSIGNVEGGIASEYVGGFCGRNALNSRIDSVYCAGSVNANAKFGAFVGGNLTGSILSNCYFDSDISVTQTVIGENTNAQAATSLTTLQFEDETNFTGFDFTNIWEIRAVSEADNTIRPASRMFCKVIFESDGHSTIVPSTIEVMPGRRISPIIVNDNGYVFNSWKDKSGIIISTNEKEIFEVTTDTNIVYTTTEATFVTVTIITEGEGDVDHSSLIVDKYTNTPLITATPRVGYEFSGWKNKSGITISTNLSESFFVGSDDMTITAAFTKKTFNVYYVYSSNAGNIQRTFETVKYGEKTLSNTITLNNGFKFDGWYSKGILLSTDPNETFTIVKDTMIIATFSSINYSVTIYQTGLENNSQSDLTLWYGEIIDGGSIISEPTGYYFYAWETKNGEPISINKNHQFTITSDSTIYAVYKKYEFTISFSTVGEGTLTGATTQIVEYNANSTPVEAIPNEGYVFTYWTNSDGDVISFENPYIEYFTKNNITLLANYEPFNPTVTIYLIKGENQNIFYISEYPYGESSTPLWISSYPGYEFVGWFSEDNQLITEDSLYYIPSVTSNTSIYMIYKTLEYTLTISKTHQFGSVDGPETQTLTYFDESAPFTAIPNENYKFKEWINSEGDIISTDNPVVIKELTSDLTLIPVFVPQEVSLENLKDQGISISSKSGNIYVQAPSGAIVHIYSITGNSLASNYMIGDSNSIEIPCINLNQNTLLVSVEYKGKTFSKQILNK